MAELSVVADNVELVANNIQNKVGSTLIGLKASAKATTDNQSAGATGVLRTIKVLQTQAVEKLTEIWEVLAKTLKFDEDTARRLREENLGLAKKAKLAAGGGPDTTTSAAAKKLGENEGGGLLGFIKRNPFLSALFITGVGGWMATTKGFMLKFGGTLLKGGFYAIAAKMIGDALVKSIGAQKGSLTEQAFSKYIPLSIFGFMMTRTLPGALVAMAAGGLFSVIEYIKGHKNFKDVSKYDWAGASLSGFAATAGLGTILIGLGAKGGAIATLGGALLAWPVVLTAGIGMMLGVGIKWLAGKIGEFKDSILDDLDEFGKLTQDEFEKRLAEQKSHWFARMFPSLAGTMGINLTDMQKANITTSDMVKDMKDPNKQLDPRDKILVEGVADNLLKMSDKGLKDVLSDKHRAAEHLDFLRDISFLIQGQAFGPEKSEEFRKLLSAHKNQLQKITMELHTEKPHETYIKDILQGKHKGAADTDEILRKMDFFPRYKSVEGLEDMEAERMKFLSDLGIKHNIREGENAPYRLKATMSPENWEKLRAMEAKLTEKRTIKRKLDSEIAYKLGPDFDYEKQIELLGIEGFLALQRNSLDVEIQKVKNKWKMIENRQGHPGEFLDMSTKAAISNTTNNKQVDYKVGSYGTGPHQYDVNKPISLLPAGYR